MSFADQITYRGSPTSHAAGGESVASLIKKVSDFARSPQGRELIAKGKKAAQDPENQRKLQKLRERIAKKR
jgi:hypothetical protein